ncbi:MAG TPA: class I SAM-dependent methyltransferase [Rhodothermales bacterium]|nr:class I SAM-dependent methyltransferase [Rhodothermales bacterium]
MAVENERAEQETVDVQPYTALAAGYDVVMEHVEYEAWAEYTHRILQTNHPDPQTVLELGCGTGSFAFELQPLGPYQYTATDHALQMIRVGRAKAELYRSPVQFAVADFTDFRVDAPVDVVILLYDGLNYVLDEKGVRALLQCTYDALRPGGLFFFDQSTPLNSINNEVYFEDAGEAEGFSYLRHSAYDRTTRLHTTTFEITAAGAQYHEEHVQRAYEMAEIKSLLKETPFEILQSFDGFSTASATEHSERIHWLLRKSQR